MKTLQTFEIEQISGGYSHFENLLTSLAFGYITEAGVSTLFANTAYLAAHPIALPLAGWIIGIGMGSLAYNVGNSIVESYYASNPSTY